MKGVVLCLVAILLPATSWSMSIDISDPRAQSKVREYVHSQVKRQTQAQDTVCAQADIVFVVDSSGSIKLENWQLVLNFTASMVESFPIGDLGARFGIVKYGNQAVIEFYLDDYNTREEYIDHIFDMRWMDQATNTSGGIYRMYNELFQEEHGDRPDVPNIGIVITDGVSNEDADLTIPRALEAKSRGITMFSLGIGEDISMDELNGIASDPYLDDEGNPVEFVFMATDFEALSSIRGQLRDAACEVTAECRVIADMLFILDGSGSVNQQNWDRMKSFVSEILDDLNVAEDETHVAVMTFSDSVEVNFYLSDRMENRATVREGIDAISYPRGTTRTFDALDVARTDVFARADNRPDVQDIIVLFTDGGSDDFALTIEAAKQVRLSDIYIFVVGITMNVNQYEINEIATDPDDANVFMARDFTELNEIRGGLKQAMCNDIDECSGSPCENGGQCTDAMNTYFCNCPEGFAGRNCQLPCAREMDINILLDASTANGRDQFYQLQQFIKDLTQALPIDSEIHSSLGLAMYSNAADVEFMMNEYRHKVDVVNGISLLWDRQGSTDTAGAIDMASNDMYTTAAGARDVKDDVLIIITDGHSGDRSATFDAARAAREAGTTFFVVGVGEPSYYDMREMHGMASYPKNETVFLSPDYDSLFSVVRPLVEAACNEEDNCADNPCGEGATCVDMVGTYRCECPQGRSGANCERGCSAQLDLVLLVDTSGSIRRHRFNDIFKPMIQEILAGLEIGPDATRVGLATFDDEVNVAFELNTYSLKEDVMQAVELLVYRAGRTNIADALTLLHESMFTDANGDRFEAPNMCLIITDGTPTVNEAETLPEAIRTRVEGIHIMVFAAELDASNLYLKGIASDPDEANVFAVDRFSEMLALTQDISMATCDDVNECDSNPCENGMCINGLAQFICLCDDDFTGRTCERRCTRSKDIVFLLDASGSMESVYDWQMRLAKEIVYGLNFAASRTRVAVITYNTQASVRFYLNEYFDRESVLNAISFLKEGGRTGTADALRLANEDVFLPQRGDREGVDNIAIVMTDGRSNENQGATIPNAEELQRGARVLSVGVGTEYDMAELSGMATFPDASNVFVMETEADIEETARRILDELCQ